MKSVLYCGCTVNAYTPCSPPRLSLSLFPPEDPAVSLVLSLSFSSSPSLPLSLSPSRSVAVARRFVVAICAISRSLGAGSANESARRRAFTAFLRYGGDCRGLGAAASATFLLFQPPHSLATTPLVPLHEFTPTLLLVPRHCA